MCSTTRTNRNVKIIFVWEHQNFYTSYETFDNKIHYDINNNEKYAKINLIMNEPCLKLYVFKLNQTPNIFSDSLISV